MFKSIAKASVMIKRYCKHRLLRFPI